MTNPPKFPLLFLRWFCNPDLLPGIEGDLLELFEENEQRLGSAKAKWKFVWDVLKLFKPSLIRPVTGTNQMNYWGLLRHNMVMSFRVLKKDQIYTIINVIGLALGIALFFAIYQFINFERSFDEFHAKGDRMFRLTSDFSIDNMERRYHASTPPRIAPFSAERIPEIENYTRLNDYFTAGHGDLTLSYGTRKFREPRVCFANPSFLEMFSFPLIKGDRKQCLDQLRTVVLTESTAKKYFGDEDPIGQIMTVDGASDLYTVTGVLEDLPPNSHIQFDVLISYKTLNWWYGGEAESHWTNHEFYSFLLLKEGVDPEVVEKKINDYYLAERGEYNSSKSFDNHFSLQPLKDIHFNLGFEQELFEAKNVDPFVIHVIASIGWLILAIAWINYINLSAARSLRRYVEMGLRRALGARNGHLIGLFVMETLLIHITAFLMAILILLSASSYLKDILGFEIGSEGLLLMIFDFRILLGALVAVFGIGLYPLLLLNKLDATHGLGSSSLSSVSKGWFIRGLTLFQFTVSTALIIGSFVLHSQLDLMRNSDSGFDRYNKIVIRGPNQTDEDSDSLFQIKHQRFMDRISELSTIRSITTGMKVPGERAIDPGAIQVKGHEHLETQTMDILSVGLNYFKTLGIKFQAGKSFSRSSDTGLAVVVNESAARLLGFQNMDSILNQKLVLNYNYELPVIGVVDDYNHLSSKHAIQPLIFYCNLEYFHYYIVDYTGQPLDVLNKSEALLAEIFPRDPFEFFFLDDQYNRQYDNDEKLGKTIILFSGMAIVIACLGLIGLSSHNTLRRVKEIGIRKTFGAGVAQILILLNKETGWLLLLANLITWPIMYQAMLVYLQNFATRITLGIEVFLLAGCTMAFLAILSISLITIKAARANPVQSLRTE